MINHNDKEWHEQRRKGCGGSDWTHILNIEPYGCSRRLWYIKRDVEPDFAAVQTGSMRRGHALEPVAVDEFVWLTGAEVSLSCNPRADGIPEWMIGNLDRDVRPTGPFINADGKGVLETKTKSPYAMQPLRKTGVPQGEICQVQHYMTMTGRSWAAYFALDVLDFDRSYFKVLSSDPELEAQMIVAGDIFWSMVENGPSPDRHDPQDKCCAGCNYREQCQGDRLVLVGAPVGDYAHFEGSELVTLLHEREELTTLLRDAEDLKKANAGRIHDLVGEGKFVDLAGSRVIVGKSQRNYLDKSALERDHPGMVEKYTKPGIPFTTIRGYGKQV